VVTTLRPRRARRLEDRMTDTFPEDEEYDLDAAVAEVSGASLRFRWKGESWVLKHMGSLDWRVTEAANQGDVEAVRTAFRYGMGAEQFDRFELVEQDTDAMSLLFSRWLRHAGTSQGESPASVESSASTEKPSRPASEPATPEPTSDSSSPASSPPASSSSS
jgi:hypothetical protein